MSNEAEVTYVHTAAIFKLQEASEELTAAQNASKMTSKTAKDIITNKLGLKAAVSKSDTDLEKLRKENAALKKAMEDISKGKGKLKEMERSRLLEKILALETEKEQSNQQLSEKIKEIQNLKEKLKAKEHGDKLHCQLLEKTNESERREQLYKSLSDETYSLKQQLYTVTAKCVELENQAIACQISQETGTSPSGSSSSQNTVEGQLKDALEKNQQWLVYDKQREGYVKGLVSRIYDLEQQLSTVTQTLQQQAKETSSEGQQQDEKQKYYDRLLVTAKKDLEAERKKTAQLSFDLTELRKKYDDKKRESMDLNNMIQSQCEEERQQRENEKRMGDKVQKLQTEVEISRQKHEEEKKRCVELSCQVQLLHKSLSKQQEEHSRISVLEHQIQKCTSELENEKLDNQNAQHQIYKVRKELRKAKEQIRLQPVKHLHEFHYTESSNFHDEFNDRLKMRDQNQSPKCSNLLDESFLECPKCKAQYPTSQHRELLAHIDYCADS